MGNDGNNLKSKPINRRSRYIYRGICTFVLTLVALMMFLIIWIGYVSWNNHTGYLMGLGNLALASLLYVLLFIVNGRFLRAFRIGVERVSKQMASIALTVLITDFFEVFVSITILNNFRYIIDFTLRYLLLAVCQVAVLAFFVFVMADLYRSLIKPLSVVLIYGDHDNDIEKKINSIPQKYHIEKTIRYDDPNLDLDDLVENCRSILINDIPSDVENAVLKKCFEKDKRVYVVPK